MARLFPLRSDTPSSEGEPRVVDLEDEDADAVFGALSSSTAREIYSTLANEPGTPSDIAEAVDSSIQNVRYHLEKLEDAGLVEVVDTWYSSRGNEMSVYATADGPLIVTSDESTASKLRTALSRFLGGVGALAAGSLLVQYGLQQYVGSGLQQDEAAPATGDTGDGVGAGDDGETDDGSDGGAGDGDDGSTDDAVGDDEEQDEGGTDDAESEDIAIQQDESDDPDETDDRTDDDNATTADEGDDAAPSEDSDADKYGGEDINGSDDGGILADVFGENPAETTEAILSSVPPGLLFFLGGVSVLTVVTAYWYWSAY
ncbi:helix-turn-helix domain-containing protein [Halostagnicola sp. A-GB9-2]|uniref:ArsR/SmtB family transcription factor n=1 Tax=Halostagnicola sp. A-GB9-2 TaxID=3048066 RepID=UPI0024C0CB4B|nr:helix-turn-helix domain-containing protein [Halostagnicola sp. A-GB9-2]MDJ1432537.1 helix-turn-helix domain-containing protein [Halostagnicola sp. A-GB9-2]